MRATTMLLTAVLLVSCTRRPLDGDRQTALIPVKIDWSDSNIPVTESDPTGGAYVHRVSLRFYPDDGSAVFERYLEGNVFEGSIDVPPGRYGVIAMNESVQDVLYWENYITFSDADSFDGFAATVDPMTDADRKARFPFYRPAEGERLIVEPLRLASWSLDDFEVTEDMVPASRKAGARDGAVPDALTRIVMRRLTHNIGVSAHVTNLASVQQMPAAVQGFAAKVYMASARTVQSPATCLLLFNSRSWDANNLDGTVSRTLLSFGRVPGEGAGSYRILVDVLLINGELYTAAGPLAYDVTEQVAAAAGGDINLVLPPGGEGGGSITLPSVEGSISVDGWEDEQVTLN